MKRIERSLNLDIDILVRVLGLVCVGDFEECTDLLAPASLALSLSLSLSFAFCLCSFCLVLFDLLFCLRWTSAWLVAPDVGFLEDIEESAESSRIKEGREEEGDLEEGEDGEVGELEKVGRESTLAAGFEMAEDTGGGGEDAG